MKRLIAVVLVTWLGIAYAQQATEVVLIKTRPAITLVEAVRPMLGEDGGASAFHDKLILRGTPEELAAAKALLAELDRPARRLFIEVRQGNQFDLETQRFDYGAQTDEIRIGRVPPGAQARLGYRQAQTRGTADVTHRVQALDGRPAVIMAGQSVPIYSGYQQIVGNQVYQGFDLAYREADSGFVALPRVYGDEVTVEIYQQDSRPLLDGRFANQQASTLLRGRLGEWLTLGSIGDSTSDDDSSIGTYATTRRSEDRQLMLRVIPVVCAGGQ